MINRLLLFILLFLCAFCCQGQTQQAVSIAAGGNKGGMEKSLACADQFAGNINFNNFLGQSTDISLDTMFFCFGDQINIVHAGNANLTGDPTSGTTPGITYGFFDCQPTVSGPNLTSILTDPCILDNPPPANDIWVTAGGSFNGNITFSNAGSLQNFFNGGDPILIWFAPLTIDNFAIKQYELDPNTSEEGPCVNLNVAQAFAVVYLNEIEITNVDNMAGMSGCGGNFRLEGGLPEWDGSNYTVSLQLLGNPAVQGTVSGGPFSHGDQVNFDVPSPGFYQLQVEDGKSCGASMILDMSACVSVTQSAPDATVAPGDNICLNITNQDGFDDIVSIQYALTWDETVLQFTNVTNLTPLLPGFNVPTSFNSLGDSLIFSYASLSGTGVDLPIGTVVYQVCFNVIGSNGECTLLEFVDQIGPGIEVVNDQGSQLGFYGAPGEICVSASALVLNLSENPVSCSGEDDGTFTATVSGGSPPFNVTWQDVSGGPIQGPGVINVVGGSFTANNISAGTYSVTVTDASIPVLIGVEDVMVTSPPLLEIIFNENSPLCNGQTGSIQAIVILDSVIVNNPNVLYDFAWSVPGSNPTISNLLSGFYSVTVTETATGCSITNSTFLPQPQPMSVSITLDTATCSGIADGNIHLMVSGGTPDNNGDYIIQWPSIGSPPGLFIQNTQSNISGLEADCYQSIVTDNNGCNVQQNVCLPAFKTLAVNAVLTPINCSNACSGSLFLVGTTTGSAPTLPYNFDWFGTPVPPPPSVETPTSSTVNGLCEGVYTIVMEDAAGCEIDTTFIFTEPTPIDVALFSATNETCSPGDDGTITVTVIGGTYPYVYDWNATTNADSTAINLNSGVYTVTVTDDLGCFDTLSVQVTAPVGPVITQLNDDQLDCSNSTNGSLTVVATGNIISYEWSNSDFGASISGLPVGQYIVTVSDGNNCEAIDTALVIAPDPLALDSVNTTSPDCPGTGGGGIQVFASGGTTPYFFNWSNGVMGNNIAVLAGATITAGTYTVTITDANDCEPIEIEVELEDPHSIVVQFTAIDSVSCGNALIGCDGSATATASYSDGESGVFNFIWQSGETDNGLMSSSAVQLCQSDQFVVVSDGACSDSFLVNIPAPLPITPGQDIDNVSCFGLSDGSITVFPEGGTAPITYVWEDGTTGPTITGLPIGIVTVVMTDSKGCVFTHDITITEPDPLELQLANANDVECFGDANGTITVLAQGGNISASNPPAYIWSNNAAPPGSNTATDLSPGIYTVTVVDSKNCMDSLSHTIIQPAPIQFILGNYEPIACFGGNTFITVDTAWGGNLSTYLFSVNQGGNQLLGAPSVVFGGENFIEVIDIEGCSADTTIEILQPNEIFLDLPDIVEIELGDSLTRLDPDIISAAPIDTFIWTPAIQLSCADCKNPYVTAIKSQLYTLTIIDVNGCSASASVLVDVDNNRNVYIPNVFSANDDGINDKFKVYTGLGVTGINFIRVYDRWGELMFEADNLPPSPDGTVGWNGMFRGERMKPAVFMYLIEVTFLDGQVLLYRGDVTLLR